MGAINTHVRLHFELFLTLLLRYYNKRPFLFDERLAVLPADLFRGARVLDVGCNEGWVTCEIGV
jgi:2-polyprenyl-3-methyl-5-hydroxy-6-metoxy-1,4-benzoquinol methylase